MKKGFYTTVGNKGFFLETTAQKKTAKVIDAMIETIGKTRGLNAGWIDRCKADPETRKRIAYQTTAATLERMDTSIEAYRIYGKNFSCAFPAADFYNEIVLATV